MANVKEGPNSLLIGIIIILVAGGLFMHFGSAPDSSSVTATNDSVKAASLVGSSNTVTPVVASILKLDSEFITLTTTDNASAEVIIADQDSVNFDEDTGKITLQLNAVIDSTTSPGNTTFTLKARNATGISTDLLGATETGTLTAPTVAMTKAMTFTFSETLTSGFTSTEQVLNHVVSASAPMLKGTPTDSAALYSPIVVRTTDTNKPDIKVDATKDSHSYIWTTSTTPKTISVTFDVSFIDIRYMPEISKTQSITITAIGTDDKEYTIEIIRNDAI